MTRKPRKHYSPQEKVAILREHFLEGKSISEVCQRHQLQPTVFYRWQKTFFENGAAAFERKNKRAEEAKDRQIAALQEKLTRKNEVIAELMKDNARAKKIHWGALNGSWVPRETRDQVVDYVRHWADRSELPVKRLLGWLGLRESKYYDWTHRYGKANEHNGQVPRAWWLEEREKQAILDFHRQHPDDSYRRLTSMMLEADVVTVSPATVYRVLSQAGRLGRR